MVKFSRKNKNLYFILPFIQKSLNSSWLSIKWRDWRQYVGVLCVWVKYTGRGLLDYGIFSFAILWDFYFDQY